MNDDIVEALRARHRECACSLWPSGRCAECVIDIAAAEQIAKLREQKERLVDRLLQRMREDDARG